MAFFVNNAAPLVQMAFNVGAFFDHQNGNWVKGTRGENLLIGGFGHNTGIMAVNNTGKTELLLEMFTKASARYITDGSVFHETEGTLDPSRIENYYTRWDPDGSFIHDSKNEMVDSSLFIDDWFNMMSATRDERVKKIASGKGLITLPFKYTEKHGDKVLPPLLLATDSYSEAASSASEEKLTKEGVIDAKNQTFDMIVGNLKTRIMHGFAQFATRAQMYVITTAVLDKFVDIGSRPGQPAPKHTAHLAADKKPKGVGSKYKGLTSSCWTFGIPKPAWKGTGKADQVPKYPLDDSEMFPGNKSYEHTELINARGKSGSSGFVTPLWKKQGVGILLDVSELAFLRDWGKDNLKLNKVLTDYGISSPAQYTFEFDLLPGVTWRNTTLRATLRDNPKAVVAISLLFGMKLEIYQNADPEFIARICSPKELYDDLKVMGYDWDVLLETRQWWTHVENEKDKLPFLSILDLLMMRTGEYIPFWFTADMKKKIDLTKKKGK
jgi:hypothetical protein